MQGFFLKFKKFSMPLILTVAIFIFFFSYNIYLVDHSLEDLKFALEQTANAETIGDTKMAGMLLDDALVNEVSELRINSVNVTSLEFTRNVIARGSANEQLKDVEFLLDKLVKEREAKRGGLLLAFDRMNSDLQKFIRFMTKELPRGALRPEVFKPAETEDLSILENAKKYEENWQFKDAIGAYEEFINKYPSSGQQRFVKLRLATAYFKSANFREARRLYKKLIEEAPQSDEAKVAENLLVKVEDRVKKLVKDRRDLLDRIAKIKGAAEQANAYYKLGMMNIYLFDLEGAGEAFKKVVALAPNTDLAKRAEFNLAWTCKLGARYDEGIEMFLKFVEQNPAHSLTADSSYQIADTYYKWGRFKEAAENYEKFSDKFADSSVAPVSLLQAGYTYLYDLRNPLKALGVFKNLKNRYPQMDVAKYTAGNLIPMIERSYRSYGFALLKEGRIEEAKEIFQKAIIYDRADAWAHCGLGTTDLLLEMINEGAESVRVGMERVSDEYTHAAMGFAYDGKKEYLNAVKEYKISIKINPDYVIARYNLGKDYVILGWYDLAVRELKEVVRRRPDFAEAHNNLGCALWYKGQVVDTEFEFKAAIAHKQNLGDAHYNLGLFYETQGKYEKAALSFRNVISIIPNFKTAIKRLEQIQAKIRK